MCLIVVAWQQHAAYPLLLAGNRDEFHQRPAQSAHWWPDHNAILGGRDLQAGGTWLALHRSGRFAAVTNFRERQPRASSLESRGKLVVDFLRDEAPPTNYLAQIDGDRFAGFNLLVGDGNTLAYTSNRGSGIRTLEPGIYGLSNALLDADWFKTQRLKASLQRLVDNGAPSTTALLRLLDDRTRAPASSIDTEHFDFETAHAVSAPFIVLPDYGTRCSSVILRHGDGGTEFLERRFDAAGATTGNSAYSF